MKAYVRRVFLPASLCLFSLLPSLGFAQSTIHVPADAPTIQTAIFAAQNGDTVLVAPGLYFESINFQGKNITVMSSDGAAVTTVDSGSQAAAQFINNENNGAVLNGFTFVNGYGIQIFSASPVIEGNVITGNQGCQAGGIMVLNGSPIIRGNMIANNQEFCTLASLQEASPWTAREASRSSTTPSPETGPLRESRPAESLPTLSAQRRLPTIKFRTTLPIHPVAGFMPTDLT